MTGDSFRKRVAALVRRAGTQAELARKSGISDRQIRSYLTTEERPRGDTAVRLAKAGNVRLQWLLTGQEPMEESATPSATHRVQSERASYSTLNLRRLALSIEAVEARMPQVSPEAKARVVATCYDFLIAKDTDDPSVLSEFLDLVAGPLEQSRYTLPEPLSDEELSPRRATKKSR